MAFDSQRPPTAKRAFTSPVIEEAIAQTCARIADPELAWLFQNCFPNTLDTTVTFAPDGGGVGGVGGEQDTFIITGDIDAMWLRDSTNQVWPYLPFANRCPKLKAMFQGLIRRQARCVLLDPYANAFYRTADKISQWRSDHTEMKPGVHERKYELDSLASVLRLATGYFEATQDPTPFDDCFIAALDLILQTITNEQAGTPEQIHPHYSFGRTTANAADTLPGGGHGNPCRRTGLSRSPFRPSDDATIFQYHVPANAMAAVMLQRTARMILKMGEGHIYARKPKIFSVERAMEIDNIGVRMFAATSESTTHGSVGGNMFIYEFDGFGSHLLMDDANVPNLMSLPYLGFCSAADPVYQNTRRFVLSTSNPYYHSGTAAKGIGGPHIGMGWIWPMSLITQAITSTDDAEILACLRTLKSTHAGTGFMHEAFWMNDPKKFTRSWFAWANSYFGELILHLAQSRPHLLLEPLA